jgi:hypothetical protein
MEDLLKQLKEAQSLGMTSSEKSAMRNSLVNLAQTPAPQQAPSAVEMPAPSPYASPSIYNVGFFMKSFAFVLAGFIISGGALTYGATKSMPGSPLFPIKIGVAETLGRSVRMYPDWKAQYDAGRVGTRLHEIDTLVVQNKIENESIVAIENTALKKTLSDYNESIDSLKRSGRVAMAGELSQQTFDSLSKYAVSSKAGATTMMMTERAASPAIGEDLSLTISEQLGVIEQVLGEVKPTPTEPTDENPIEVPTEVTPTPESPEKPSGTTTTTKPAPEVPQQDPDSKSTVTVDPATGQTVVTPKPRGAAGY